MNPLLEALNRAEKAFSDMAERVADLSKPFMDEDAQTLLWLSETYEMAKIAYWSSLVEGMKVIPQA